jgi:hypothetical protein
MCSGAYRGLLPSPEIVFGHGVKQDFGGVSEVFRLSASGGAGATVKEEIWTKHTEVHGDSMVLRREMTWPPGLSP